MCYFMGYFIRVELELSNKLQCNKLYRVSQRGVYNKWRVTNFMNVSETDQVFDLRLHLWEYQYRTLFDQNVSLLVVNRHD